MFKPVAIDVRWTGPYPILNAFDPSTAHNLNANWPGVYLHVTRDAIGGVAATYVGKHRQSVIDRQSEHLSNYADGKYHLIDGSGNIVFLAKSIIPANFHDLLSNHLCATEIYFGNVSLPSYGSVDHWVDMTESLLLASPSWRSSGGKILNYRQEDQKYMMHDKCEIRHQGASVPIGFFGNTTTWDRSTWKVV
ncbi:hypothetical protein J2848_000351 [Azospirillum lipoferum]|uniref:GIY-YIG domain-containing protein n=1 Tax=Azospirillum lipoferum TaxID=193 RepID=A0A5A9GS42_AZOLI|nr:MULTISPECIES: hypothetical protein [Azospirillum]KAA0597207.1 hypothetical protein FZ942_08930 [Azospirillum lipoferum]MCP1608715.1 hypothetical protein [Azospirillum lipoferum]MDW5535967.1 hypothetical protein [Azospirillum sp. NL1]